MSDFRKLGNTLIDFDQVRMIEALEEAGGNEGVRIVWKDSGITFILDDKPTETISAAFNSALERFKERQKNGDMK